MKTNSYEEYVDEVMWRLYIEPDNNIDTLIGNSEEIKRFDWFLFKVGHIIIIGN